MNQKDSLSNMMIILGYIKFLAFETLFINRKTHTLCQKYASRSKISEEGVIKVCRICKVKGNFTIGCNAENCQYCLHPFCGIRKVIFINSY